MTCTIHMGCVELTVRLNTFCDDLPNTMIFQRLLLQSDGVAVKKERGQVGLAVVNGATLALRSEAGFGNGNNCLRLKRKKLFDTLPATR